MKRNMGKTDRLLRTFVAAPVLIIVGVVLGPTALISWVLYVLAVVMVATSSVSFCPIYRLFGLNTDARESAGSERTKAPVTR